MTPKFKLSFDIDNAAFWGDPSTEIATILRAIAIQVESGRTDAPVFDVNGNRIGEFSTDELEEGEG